MALCARILIVLCAFFASACGDSDPAPPTPAPAAPLVVLSAFPAELAAVLGHVEVTGSMEIEGRVFRSGTIGGVPVVVGMTGIGLANASAVTRTLLERVTVAGVVVSGVANSTLRIGDVAVATSWRFKDGTTFSADPQWLDLAAALSTDGKVALESCTLLPALSATPVCLSQPPAIVVGGIGQSTDPFHGRPFPCQPDGGDLYGCDAATTSSAAVAQRAYRVIAAVEEPTVNDMETAAMAQETAARGLPFIAFRAVSDGAGDPLHLPTVLDQFGAYYAFAAHNAAAAMSAFVERLGR